MADIAPARGYSVVRNLDELRGARRRKLLGIFTGVPAPLRAASEATTFPASLDRLIARGAATIRAKARTTPRLA